MPVRLSLLRLERSIACHPVWWFLLLAVAPAAGIAYAPGLRNTVHFAPNFIVLPGTMLVAWAGDLRPKFARCRGRRTLVFACVLALCLTPFAFGALPNGLPDMILLTASWALAAAALAYLLACWFSPTAALRELVRPLLPGKRSLLPCLFAVVWPLLSYGLAMAAGHIWPQSYDAFGSPPPSYLTYLSMLWFELPYAFSGLMLGLPVVIVWYGFVARRLQGRLSPLLIALPLSLIASWGSIDGSVALGIAGSYAMVLVALALFRRSHGNLLPLVLLFTIAPVANIAALWSVRLQTGLAYDITLIGLQWLAAGVFVVTGGLWRRPARPSGEAVAVAALP